MAQIFLDNITDEEVKGSVCELQSITPDEVKDYDVVVVGAGAAGVPAACKAAELGAKVALLYGGHAASAAGAFLLFSFFSFSCFKDIYAVFPKCTPAYSDSAR